MHFLRTSTNNRRRDFMQIQGKTAPTLKDILARMIDAASEKRLNEAMEYFDEADSISKDWEEYVEFARATEKAFRNSKVFIHVDDILLEAFLNMRASISDYRELADIIESEFHASGLAKQINDKADLLEQMEGGKDEKLTAKD